MIKVGIAGIGFMGMIHYLTYQKIRGVKVVAICEQVQKRLDGDWRDIKGNFGPAGKKMNLKGIATYRDLDDLLDDPDIDMVDVCLPPRFHPDTTIRALKAGKHVFCEKPIALTAKDARRMVAAAEKADRTLMIGHVLPMVPEYEKACQLIQSGKYGRLLGGNFKRVISDPSWLPNFFDPEAIGGPMFDLHIHDAHFIRLVCGMPDSLFTTGRMRGDTAEYFTTHFTYFGSNLAVTATSGVINQQGRAFTHAFEIHLERATLLFDFAVIDDKPQLLTPFTVLDDKGRVLHPKLAGSGDPLQPFESEIKKVTRALRSGKASPILDGQLARDAVVLCQKQTQSLKTGRSVRI